jgi:PPOX class probable F420-dependent enzyme
VTPEGRDHPSWSEVAGRLAPLRTYWLCTTSRDGSPHAAPVWGVVWEDRFYIYSERKTAKARNLARDSRAVVHLESADDVVIVRGRLDDVGGPEDVPGVVDAFAAKYDAPEDHQYLPSSDESFDVLYRLRPDRALLWNLADYDNTQKRWTVGQEPT